MIGNIESKVEDYREELPIDKDEVKKLLTMSISRTKKRGSAVVEDYDSKKLTFYHGKSRVYRVFNIHYRFPEREFDVPPSIVVKFYSQEGDELTREFNKHEYEIEKKMLEMSDELSCWVDGREVRVYPIYFSDKVEECDKHLCLVRAYVNEDSLLNIVQNKKKEKNGEKRKIRWDDINGTISSLALLHINDSWIRERIGFSDNGKIEGVSSGRYGEGYMSDNLVKHIERLAYISGHKIDEELKNQLRENSKEIFSKYLFRGGLIRVINGDLSVCPHHATNDILLDAGGTVMGPFTEDLSLYSDPIFEGVLDYEGKPMNLCSRGEKTICKYLEEHEKIADILQYPNNIEKKLSKDFLINSFFVNTIRGNIRGASAALSYKYKFANNKDYKTNSDTSWTPRIEHLEDRIGQPKEPSIKYLQQEAADYVDNVYNAIDLLKDGKDKILFEKFKDLISKSLPHPYKIKKDIEAEKVDLFISSQNKKRHETAKWPSEKGTTHKISPDKKLAT